MDVLIALGVLFSLIIGILLAVGWTAMVDRLSERFEWPFWVNGTITFTPGFVAIYIVILVQIRSS